MLAMPVINPLTVTGGNYGAAGPQWAGGRKKHIVVHTKAERALNRTVVGLQTKLFVFCIFICEI